MEYFELKKIVNNSRTDHILFVDGIEVDEGEYFVHEDGDELFLRIDDSELYERFLEFGFADLKKEITEINLQYPFTFDEDVPEIQLSSIGFKKCNGDRVAVHFNFVVDAGGWKKPWSIVDYQEGMKKAVEEYKYEGIGFEPVDEEAPWEGFALVYDNSSSYDSIMDDIDTAIDPIDEIHKNVVLALYHSKNTNSIIIPFSFPEEVKVPCEQYLLYFVEFLKDVGIEAKAGIQDNPGEVLFSVTPSDSEEALENIQLALDLYLRLPQSPIQNSNLDLATDIKTQQLIANIQHLQGQLALAGALIQQKDQLLGQQAILINQQNLSTSVLLKSIVPDKPDKEDVLGGLISAKGYDLGFAEINVHTIVRKLKDYFNNRKK